MRIRLLGTGTPTPSLRRMCSGYLVEIGVPDPATRASIIRIWDIEREFK